MSKAEALAMVEKSKIAKGQGVRIDFVNEDLNPKEYSIHAIKVEAVNIEVCFLLIFFIDFFY